MHSGCPCGSNHPYTECCAPLIEGERQAETAEALMRSRYTAYTLARADYLLATWHPSTRPQRLDFDYRHPPEWRGLTIHATKGGGADETTGVVEFTARLAIEGREEVMHETSRFQRYQGRWVYLDGVIEGEEPGVKVGRNSLCPCGSGKKYKRCCGAS